MTGTVTVVADDGGLDCTILSHVTLPRAVVTGNTLSGALSCKVSVVVALVTHDAHLVPPGVCTGLLRTTVLVVTEIETVVTLDGGCRTHLDTEYKQQT